MSATTTTANAVPRHAARLRWQSGGDNWAVWQNDFFDPAAPLLAAAPWVLVRGNHELCRRGGHGWFRFLDRLPMERTCRDLTGIFVARLGEFGVDRGRWRQGRRSQGRSVRAGQPVARPVHSTIIGEGAGGSVDHQPSPVECHARSNPRPTRRERWSTTRCRSSRFGPVMPSERPDERSPATSISSRRSTSATRGRRNSWSAPAATTWKACRRSA